MSFWMGFCGLSGLHALRGHLVGIARKTVTCKLTLGDLHLYGEKSAEFSH